jgi:hypothetical protein
MKTYSLENNRKSDDEKKHNKTESNDDKHKHKHRKHKEKHHKRSHKHKRKKHKRSRSRSSDSTSSTSSSSSSISTSASFSLSNSKHDTERSVSQSDQRTLADDDFGPVPLPQITHVKSVFHFPLSFFLSFSRYINRCTDNSSIRCIA